MIGMLLGVLLSAPTFARDCPWPDGVDSVIATGTTVTINGKLYPVNGNDTAELAADFDACGIDGTATVYLNEWRRKRTNAFITGGFGLLVWPLWIATGIQISSAVQNRNAMVSMVLASD